MLTICAAEAVVSTARLADLQAEIGAAQRGAAAARALLTAAYTDGHRAGVAAARQRAAGAEAKTGRVNAAALAEQHAIRAYRRAATAELLTQMERALEAEAALADFWRLRGLDRFSA